MGSNLKIMGNTFSNVSSITAHDATSGTHTYYDNSQVNAVASDVRSGKKIMNSSGEVTGTLASYNFTTYDLTNTTWRFKDYSEIEWTYNFYYTVRFISNDVIFKSIAKPDGWEELDYGSGNKTEKSYNSSYHGGTVWLEFGWVNEYAPFRVVKFLENGNTTSEFFDWLNNNATLVSAEGVFYDNDNITETRQLKSFDGNEIKLLTRNQICSRNITVYNKKPEVEELDVNFFDYDGTILYSYGYQEFANLSAFPTCSCDTSFNPSYNTAEWNWTTLAAAKTYVASNKKLQIGKQYTRGTNSAYQALAIKVRIEEEFTSPTLCLGVDGTAVIRWGDGQSSLLTGTDVDTLLSVSHTYSYAGDFWITVIIDNDKYIKVLGNTHSLLLSQNGGVTTKVNRGFYQNCIKEVWVGNNCYLGESAFAYCSGLEKIILANDTTCMTTIPQRTFYMCTGLKSIIIPKSVTSIGDNAFVQCFSINEISLPNTLTTIGASAFQWMTGISTLTLPNSITTVPATLCQQNYNCSEIIIPEGVTTISASAFLFNSLVRKINIPSTVTSIDSKALGSLLSLQEMRFNNTTPPTILNSDAFDGLQTDCKIYFPITWDSNLNSNINNYAYGTNYPGGYGEDYNRKFIGYGNFTTSTSLPGNLDGSWTMHWYATKKEAVKDSGTRLTKGNGTEIYCRMSDGFV